jgi:translation initiation factor IF-2
MTIKEFAIEFGISEIELIEKFAKAGIDKTGSKEVLPEDRDNLINFLNGKTNKPKLSLGKKKTVVTEPVDGNSGPLQNSSCENSAVLSTPSNTKVSVAIKRKRVLNKPKIEIAVQQDDIIPEIVESIVQIESESVEDSTVEAQNNPTTEAVTNFTNEELVESKKKNVEEVKNPSKKNKKTVKMKVIGAVSYEDFAEDEIDEDVSVDILQEAERKIKTQVKLKKNSATKSLGHVAAVEDIKIQEFKKPVSPQVLEVIINDIISVGDLAHKLSIKISFLMKMLMKMGVICSMNQTLDQETASLIVEEMGHKPILAKTEEDAFLDDISYRNYNNQELVVRAPIVTMMGHVDHGKTSLLDYIRKTKVVAKEVGGITQHIGAYHVETETGMVTFLDTPGHEAFTALRARGAKITDIVVLVVAADDGIMSQTIEAVHHAKAAGVPIVIAINKIDKPGAEIDRIKQDLLQHEIVIEEFGGEIMAVPISAKTGQGIDKLLEVILLQAEILELKAHKNALAKGIIIESRIEKGRGVVVSALVQSGTLQKGDVIIAGISCGRVRAMHDECGRNINQAGPSIPVEILGLTELPNAGDELLVVKDEKKAREIASAREHKIKQVVFARQQAVKLENMFCGDNKAKNLAIIIKADTQGSYEAMSHALQQLSTEQVKVNIVHMAVGGINESDVNLAIASNAVIFGFNVRADNNSKKIAETQGVDIHYDNIIYDIVDKVKAALLGMTPKEQKEHIIGNVEIRQVFTINKVTIAGAFVLDGIVKRDALTRVVRDSLVIFTGKIATLRRFKDEAKEVRAGYECGLTVSNFPQLQEKDILEIYEIQEVMPSGL